MKGCNNTLPSMLERFWKEQPYKTCRYESQPMHRIIIISNTVSIKDTNEMPQMMRELFSR